MVVNRAFLLNLKCQCVYEGSAGVYGLYRGFGDGSLYKLMYFVLYYVTSYTFISLRTFAEERILLHLHLFEPCC